MHIRNLCITALLALGTASQAAAQAPAAGTDLWKECQSQQSDQALKACTAIIDAKSEPAPKLAQAYNMRALAYQRMGQPDKAIADFGQAIQLMKDAGKSGFELAFIYFMRANTHRAKGDLEQAIADHSEVDPRGAGLGQVLQRPWRHLFPEGRLRPRSRRHQQGDLVPAGQSARGELLRHSRHAASTHGRRRQGPGRRRPVNRARSALGNGPLCFAPRSTEALGRSEEAAAGMRAALAIDPRIKGADGGDGAVGKQ